ncbi:hypothetical protein A2767_00900 [Candidatus Roizmanbacteria bacterium RIFCSPHIGHO2_01_FULL_35_10]|uniref:Uncharacterized protein n=1 Tax=Candidatus Roizmanbacteria bacterium RIFCSPLOWO2_01_FULL_35_13 TaxID=1802055 RepID=A0A1F7IDE6_9BACT|nr:MAG: hypothetical protein A2767_00900 [Candidatus Roizmanbacteria bacterium RIFCSPHIGHO2_01_FULL_35_10]OGK41361.1 MAG: hypothetical protein A3A74_03445 [Candidatus Roizmanbacteria bacterium RIFCSPLOWO2_01_FULL_35_13]
MSGKVLNLKQKENMATFYNNLALVIVTAGIVSPLYTGMKNFYLYFGTSIASLIISFIFLKVSLDFLNDR